MTFPPDPPLPSPHGLDDARRDSPDRFPPLTTDGPPTVPRRPSVPPLGIRHIMLWTACTAGVLVIWRAIGLQATEPTFQQMLAAAGALVAGPALASVLLFPAWRAGRYRFPSFGGEWLLLVMGCM